MGDISKQLFESRVQRLAQQWPWPSADALLVVSSSNQECKDSNDKAAEVLHFWFFNVVFPDTILLLERSGKVAVWATAKKLRYFDKLELTQFPCDKKFPQEDQQKFLERLRAVPVKGNKLVIATPSESHFGAQAEETMKLLTAADFLQTLDAVPEIKELLASKDEAEVQHAKRASLFGCLYMQEVLVGKWMDVLDRELTTSHTAIVRELEELADKEEGLKELCAKLSIESENVEVARHLVLSGRNAELDLGIEASKGNLPMTGTFLLGVVVKHCEYHAVLTRTYIVSPTETMKRDYIFARDVLKHAANALTAGTACKDVYAAARDFVSGQRPDLNGRFGEDVGFMTGLCLQEQAWTLSPSCAKQVPANSTFVVSIRIKAHPTDEAGPPIWLTETVYVPASGKTEIMTSQCGSLPSDCFYELEDEEEPAPPPPAVAASSSRPSTGAPPPERPRSRSRDRASAKPAAKEKAAPRQAADQAAKAKAKAKAKGSPKTATKPAANGQASMTAYTRQAKPKEAPEPPRAEKRRAEPPPKPRRAEPPPPKTRRAEPRKPPPVARPPLPVTGPTLGRTTRTTTQRAKEAFAEQVELEERQKLLRYEKLEELKKRFAEHGAHGFGGPMASTKRTLAECQAYESPADIPKVDRIPGKPPLLHVDMKAEALLVPYQGTFLPFHVRTIKNMTRNEHDGEHFFRVNFLYPGQGKSAEDYPRLSEKTVYVKELTFKSKETETFEACLQDFKEVQRRMKEGALQAKHRAEAQQSQVAPLRELKGGPCIRDVNVRPSLRTAARGSVGNLEAHANGLRFSLRGSTDKVEIPYSHIKTAIFQAAERGSLVVYIHIYLKPNMGLMIGKRSTHHIQFYTEVRSQVEDLGKRRTANAHDPDEIQEEQREEQLKQRLNELFRDFSSKLEKIQDFPVRFQVPEEGPFEFTGVPHKANIRLFCCAQALVGIEEWPPLVLDIRDVEIVVFERAVTMTREFDMVLVMKNYNEQPVRITMIPSSALSLLKAWLADLQMVWYSINMNMQWQNVMKEVSGNLAEFLENGGWQAWFTAGSDDSDAGERDDDDDEDFSDPEEEDDDNYDGANIEEDSSAEDEVEEEEDDDEDEGDEDEDYDDDNDDEDSGLDWEELEKEAAEADKRATNKSRSGNKGASKAQARKPRR